MSAPFLADLRQLCDGQQPIALYAKDIMPCAISAHGKEKLLYCKEYDNIDLWGWFFFGHLGHSDISWLLELPGFVLGAVIWAFSAQIPVPTAQLSVKRNP